MAWYRCVGGAGGSLKLRTASGRIATFETNIETAFVSLKSDINPVQDLHGYSKPWSGGGGKNKLNYEAWKTVSANNGTAVFENNGVTLTATKNDCYTLSNADMRVPISEGETVTLSWQETANVNGAIYIFPNGTTSGMVYAQNASVKKLSYTATSGVTFITWRFGVQSAGVTAYYKNIQIEKGSQATSFEPYSNICPISGFSALNVTLADGDMQTIESKTVNFGQTVYGGVADVTNGKVNKTHALTPLNNKSWVKSGNKFYTKGFDNAPDGALYTGDFACAIGTPVNKEWNALSVGECCLRNGLYSLNNWSFVYCTDAYSTVEEFVSALNADCTITYPLATPIEITTTPENLTALSGQTNNVYGDTNGDTEVKYLYRE